MSDWNSKQYLKFAAKRTQPAIDLANRLTAHAPARVLDLGCGPGNSTAVLKKYFPAAELLGVDNSPAMIEQAKQDYPDLSFRLFDANDSFHDLGDQWDVIFSNACLQWVPDHQTLLVKLLDALTDNGELAVQIPLQTKAPFHALLRQIVTSERWLPFFRKHANYISLGNWNTVNCYKHMRRTFSCGEAIIFTFLSHRKPCCNGIREQVFARI